jgi:hypothetical protein
MTIFLFSGQTEAAILELVRDGRAAQRLCFAPEGIVAVDDLMLA